MIANQFRFACLLSATLAAQTMAQDAKPGYFDHHVHVLSPTLIANWKSLGMRFSREDEAYSNPLAILKQEGTEGAFLVSMAHLYTTDGFRAIEANKGEEQQLVQAENDYIARCVAKSPRNLVGFFSVNPLTPYATEELRRCKKVEGLTGLKLHLPACGIDLVDKTHLEKLESVFAWAESERVPVLLHLFSGAGAEAAQVDRFWQLVRSHKELSLYIAHLGAAGGYNESSRAVLKGFELLCEQHPAVKHSRIWFDFSGAILTEETDGVSPTSEADCAALSKSIQRIGINHFLFASDYPVFSVARTAQTLRDKLSLSDKEVTQLLSNRSPEFGDRQASTGLSTKLIAVCEGFSLPETVLHDPERDCYFVSCMVGNPTARDNNGEVRVIDPNKPDVSREFIRGGARGVTLHGPKGMAVDQDTLWVADIDTLRGFDKKTGRPTKTIELEKHGAVAINDIAADPRGTIYVSDPRLIFDDDGESSHVGVDRIFAVSPNGVVRTMAKSNDLSQPNGLAWDEQNKRLLVAPLNSTNVLSVVPDTGQIEVVAVGPGRFDGIELLGDGSILVSCLREGTIRDVSKRNSEALISKLQYPGNFEFDRQRGYLVIPLIIDGDVEIWSQIND